MSNIFKYLFLTTHEFIKILLLKLIMQNTFPTLKEIRVYSEPHMNDHDSETWTQVSMNNTFRCGSSYMNFLLS